MTCNSFSANFTVRQPLMILHQISSKHVARTYSGKEHTRGMWSFAAFCRRPEITINFTVTFYTGQWKEREGVSSGLNHFFYHLKISWAQSQSLHTSLVGTAVERKKTLLSNRAIQVIKNWVVIHKQGLQATAMHMDLVELNSLYKQIKLHRSCSLLELSRVQCRQRVLLILYFLYWFRIYKDRYLRHKKHYNAGSFLS